MKRIIRLIIHLTLADIRKRGFERNTIVKITNRIIEKKKKKLTFIKSTMAVRDYFRIDIRGLSVQREFPVRWRGQLTETVPFSVFTIAVNKISWSRQAVITVTKIKACDASLDQRGRARRVELLHTTKMEIEYTHILGYTSIETEKTYSLLEIRIHTCLHTHIHTHTYTTRYL